MTPCRSLSKTRFVSFLLVYLGTAALRAGDVSVELGGYSTECGIAVRHNGNLINATWRMAQNEYGRLQINLDQTRPLIAILGMADTPDGPAKPLLQEIDPVAFVTVGTRVAPAGRPPQMSIWNVFFDKPANRPHQTYRTALEPRRVRVTSAGKRASISIGNVTAGPFSGEWVITLYDGTRLMHIEAVLTTAEERCAIIYDAGLAGHDAGWRHVAWLDTNGRWQRENVTADVAARPLAVRHRSVMAESKEGAIACFPPPHQFQFPRDWSDNFKFTWMGRGHHDLEDRFGFGVRQDSTGGGAFVPWFNAPPNTAQRLGVFFLIVRGSGEDALRETLRYTHGDRFPALPGHVTFTSHYHMAVAVTAMNERAAGKLPRVPDFVRVFKDMGVQSVHLGEFHGDGHQKDPGPLRVPEMAAMFDECQRLSDDDFLLLPGEEVNDFLGIKEPGKHPGHWMSLFPRPVLWVMQRGGGQPVAEPHEKFGTLYRVGSRADMVELLKSERGLAWAAHPRIKASSWTPDIFRHEDFYLADFWLGAAWKAMPADLSRERLGERGLDLLDDMANWGQKKYLPGEVDVFKIDRTHELYGHMNINYLRLDRLPRYEEGWQPILDTLRSGRFFVTTGEVLIHDFSADGKASGETVRADPNKLERIEVRAAIEWTFPLRFAELISGDGQKVYRERLDLFDTGSFGQRTIKWQADLRGRRWVRVEVWDVAANGAFTQPVWIE